MVLCCVYMHEPLSKKRQCKNDCKSGAPRGRRFAPPPQVLFCTHFFIDFFGQWLTYIHTGQNHVHWILHGTKWFFGRCLLAIILFENYVSIKKRLDFFSWVKPMRNFTQNSGISNATCFITFLIFPSLPASAAAFRLEKIVRTKKLVCKNHWNT